jgi:hypothetical protein
LAVRGIVFVPDYLANAGGVIDFHQETIDDQPAAVLASVARIGAITRGVLRCAAATGATPLSVADDIVRARHPAGVASQHQGAAPPPLRNAGPGAYPAARFHRLAV